MYKLEHEGKEQDTKKDSAPRIAQMVQIADRVKDDYLANRYCQQLQVQVRNEVKCGEINTSRPFWTLK